jgi:RHS repeat-associated protein
MSGRTFNSNSYKYGFNGKEKDEEIKGDGDSYDFGARIYDNRLGRWWAMDPLQAKYPSLSPFSFVGNMPIIAIDPDGKVIKIISTDPEFRAKTFAQLQKLSNVQLVLLKNGIVCDANKVKDFPVDIVEQKGEVGAQNKDKAFSTGMIADLISNEKVVKIDKLKGSKYEKFGNCTVPDNDNSYDPASAGGIKYGSDGSGSGSTIYYDPDATGDKIVNDDLSRGRSPQSGLGHELGHSENNILGVANHDKEPNYVDPDNCKKGTLEVEEIKVRRKDNKIRTGQGDKPRATPNTK